MYEGQVSLFATIGCGRVYVSSRVRRREFRIYRVGLVDDYVRANGLLLGTPTFQGLRLLGLACGPRSIMLSRGALQLVSSVRNDRAL